MTSTTMEEIRWYAHNTHCNYTLDMGFGLWSWGLDFGAARFGVWTLELLEMLLATERRVASLQATLRGRERIQLRVLYTRNVVSLGRAVLWASARSPLGRRRGPGSGLAPGGLGCAVERTLGRARARLVAEVVGGR